MTTQTTRFQSLLFMPLLLLTSRSGADDHDTAPLTAQQILDRMASAYANCKSYRDAGIVKSLTKVRKGSKVETQQEEVNFTTVFVRPDRFRFEYKKPLKGRLHNSGIVWRQGNEVQVWPNLFRLKKSVPLNTGVATATGVSDGSAHTISALLMPQEVSGWRLTQMTDTKRTENAKQNNLDCFRILGRSADAKLNMQSQFVLWLDKQTFLVRRIDEERRWKFDGMDFAEETTTTYDPAIDETMPDNKLLFNPPTDQ